MVNNIGLSDRHRFGKSVLLSSNQSFFSKPRSVTLEEIFLSTSEEFNPIRNFLNYNFSLDITPINIWSGECENISSLVTQNRPTCHFPFSKLLSLCTYLGINDLHQDNIKFIQNNNKVTPIPIDIETVLFKCSSAGDTALIPSLITRDKFGFKQGNSNVISSFSTAKLLDSFYEDSLIIFNQISIYWDYLTSKMSNEPIRIIIKPTNVYYEYFNNNNKASFFAEELFQLKNGDIPYFFCYLGDPQIYYFNSTKTYAAVETKEYSRSTDYIFNSKTDFCNKTRLENLLHVSLLQIVNSLKLKANTKIHSKYFKIDIDAKKIEINSDNFCIETNYF